MSDLKTSVVVDLKGNLKRQARQYSQSLGKFSRSGQKQMSTLSKSVRNTNKVLGSMGKLFAGLAVAGAGTQIGGFLLDFEAQMARARTDMNLTAEQAKQLHDEVVRVSGLNDIRIAPEVTFAALNKAASLVGFSDQLLANTENMARFVQGGGALPEDAGSFVAALFDKGITSPQKIEQIGDKTIQQGTEGSFLFKDAAKFGAKIFSAFPDQKPTDLTALATVVQKATGGESAQSTTAIEALSRSLFDPKKSEKLRKDFGIEVKQRDESGQLTEKLRNLPDLLLEIVKKTGGSKFKQGEIFDAESMRVLNGLNKEGSIELFNNLRALKATGDKLREFSQINASTTKAQIADVGFGIGNFLLERFSDGLSEFSQFTDTFDKKGFGAASAEALGFKDTRSAGEIEKQGEGLTLDKLLNLRFSDAESSVLPQTELGARNKQIQQVAGQSRNETTLQEALASSTRNPNGGSNTGVQEAENTRKFSAAVDKASNVLENIETTVKVEVTAAPGINAKVVSSKSKGGRNNRGTAMAGVGTQ